MIESKDLATARVVRTIFHDVPVNRKGQPSRVPTLATALTTLDARRRGILQSRLSAVIASKAAYAVRFADTTSSPTPATINDLTSSSKADKQFIAASQALATFLTGRQIGSMSPGLLCVMEITCGAHRAVGILKLEREEGAQLQLSDTATGRAFELAVLDSLVLTEGTRLFKAALFIRRKADEISAAVCDGQRSVHSADDVAHFWLDFLGCQVLEAPRVTTERWFDCTVKFINDYIPDSEQKNEVYNHLISELKSNKATVTPRSFVKDYIPQPLQDSYDNFLKENHVTLTRFTKDTADISTRLRRKSLTTSRGIQVTVPEDQEGLVDVTSEDITIRDTLEKYR